MSKTASTKTLSPDAAARSVTLIHSMLICETNSLHSVGLSLSEQLLPPPQTVPIVDTDWRLDGLVVGDGRYLERPVINEDQ